MISLECQDITGSGAAVAVRDLTKASCICKDRDRQRKIFDLKASTQNVTSIRTETPTSFSKLLQRSSVPSCPPFRSYAVSSAPLPSWTPPKKPPKPACGLSLTITPSVSGPPRACPMERDELTDGALPLRPVGYENSRLQQVILPLLLPDQTDAERHGRQVPDP